MLLRCRIPLREFTLDIDADFDARVTAIFGPSGSGKTTVLVAIAGLRAVAAGEIETNGRTLFSSAKKINLAPQQRGIGYVPQEGALFPHLSVRKNILFGATRHAGPTATSGINLTHVANTLEIDSLLDRPVTQISGGEAQRVALARAILSHPRLLLLDEPLAALDIGLKERILPYLARVRDEFAIPMIYVTHNPTEVLTLADWVLMISKGDLVAQGTPREVLHSARSLMQIAEDQLENVFSAEMLELDPVAGASRVRLESGAEIFVPFVDSSRRLQIGISADDIMVATERPRNISAGNVLPGRIERIEPLGGDSILQVQAGGEFCVRLTRAAVARLNLRPGIAVFLIAKTRSFRVL
jgi:molybdate transport system ATP-binding protein